MADRVKKGISKTKATTKNTAPAKPRKQAAAANGGAGKNGAKVTEMEITQQQVAELAHRFWNERGRQHGYHEQDWYRAEQELYAASF